jgi:hypothetical protein
LPHAGGVPLSEESALDSLLTSLLVESDPDGALVLEVEAVGSTVVELVDSAIVPPVEPTSVSTSGGVRSGSKQPVRAKRIATVAFVGRMSRRSTGAENPCDGSMRPKDLVRARQRM